MGYKIAVVGATGVVGREMLNILSEREFDINEVVPLASSRSLGKEVSYGEERILKCLVLEDFDFTGTDIALFALPDAQARKFAPIAVNAGSVVIDNSATFRMEPDVPLVVPEVNADAIERYSKRGIIANPNCSTAQMVVALKPLHDVAKIRRIVVSTYQAVSGAGNDPMDELFAQTRAIFVADPPESQYFTKQIAFNVIPHIGSFQKSGYTGEEEKMNLETKKIMDPDVNVVATCVRVPVFVGHSEAINVEFESEMTVASARRILREAPGCIVVDERNDGGYVTPIECVGEYATYISRIRADDTVKHGLNLWVVADNLRKGAALNAVQIAEILVARYLQKAA